MNLESVFRTRESTCKVLFVEDDLEYAGIIRRRLSEATNPCFFIEHVTSLQSAFERLEKKERFDVVLLDLFLPDSQRLVTFLRLHAHTPTLPIVVMTSLNDETVGLEAVRNGAQEYLVKGHAEGKFFPQILWYAIERHRLLEELRGMSLTDDLTNLYNRRGFSLFVGQQLDLARRNKKGSCLIFLDVDKLKLVNDTHGHLEGDKALVQVAEILKAVFRKSDIKARLGGDEFAVLAIDSGMGGSELIFAKLQERLKDFNEQKKFPFELSLSRGGVFFDPSKPCSLEELMGEADRAMYHHKRSKQVLADQHEGKKRILVVDDDEEHLNFVGLQLKKSGFEPILAADGKEGLEKARREGPDLMILDLVLPELPGEDICKAIREDEDEEFSRTPIIMLTAKTTEVDRIVGKVIGANSYLTKPFSADTLLKEIKRFVSE